MRRLITGAALMALAGVVTWRLLPSSHHPLPAPVVGAVGAGSIAAPSVPEGPTAPPSIVAVPTPIPPARPTQTRVARSAPAARQAPVAPRGVVFTSYLSSYIPAASLPLALGIIADMCDQENAIEGEAVTHWGEWGKDADQDELGALHAVMELYKDARKQLAAIPGSTFDRAAFTKLRTSKEFHDTCRTNMTEAAQ